MSQSKFIITGTGRSGTKYCQAILRICGIKCGHQTIFRHENTLNKEWDWLDFAGDSSFEAVPLLRLVKKQEPETKIILVKRNKINTIASQLKWGWFSNMKTEYALFTKVLNKYFPDVLKQPTAQQRAELYYELWNAEAERYADSVYQLEDLNPLHLFEELGLMEYYDKPLVEAVSDTINSKLR